VPHSSPSLSCFDLELVRAAADLLRQYVEHLEPLDTVDILTARLPRPLAPKTRLVVYAASAVDASGGEPLPLDLDVLVESGITQATRQRATWAQTVPFGTGDGDSHNT
jgi:hypothetical protein